MGKGADRRGFCGYDNVHEWREATFGDVRNTWNPSRKGGFAGYANVDDWRKATFGSDTSPATGPCGPSHPSTDAHTRYEHVAPEIPSGRIKPLSLIEKIASSENETISYLGKLNNMSFGRAAIVSEFTNDATRDRLPALEKLFTPERMIDLAQACQIKDLDIICWFPVAIETLRNDSWRQNPGRHERYEDLGSGRAEGCDIYFERRVVACAVPVQIAA